MLIVQNELKEWVMYAHDYTKKFYIKEHELEAGDPTTLWRSIEKSATIVEKNSKGESEWTSSSTP